MADAEFYEPKEEDVQAYLAWHKTQPVYTTFLHEQHAALILEQVNVAKGIQTTFHVKGMYDGVLEPGGAASTLNRVDKSLLQQFADIEPLVNHIGYRNYRLISIHKDGLNEDEKNKLIALNPSLFEMTSRLSGAVMQNSHDTRSKTRHINSYGRVISMRAPREFQSITLGSNLVQYGHKLVKIYLRINIHGFHYMLCQIQGNNSIYVTLLTEQEVILYEWIDQARANLMESFNLDNVKWPAEFLDIPPPPPPEVAATPIKSPSTESKAPASAGNDDKDDDECDAIVRFAP